MPHNWTVESLFKKHGSQPPNPKIAYGFYRAGLIESWGRGIERIVEACEFAGIQMPTFGSVGDVMEVEFIRSDYAGGDPGSCGSVNENKNDPIKDGVKDGVTDIQAEMLNLIRKNPEVTATALAVELGINRRNTEKNIKVLKESGLLKRIGADRNGHWEVVE